MRLQHPRSSNNLLRVLEVVAVCGPINLDNVSLQANLSRSSAFRALKKLEVDGWIRTCLDSRGFVVTRHLDKISEAVSAPFGNFDSLIKAIKATKILRSMHVFIYQQVTTHSLQLLDSSLGVNHQQYVRGGHECNNVQSCLRYLQEKNLAVGIPNPSSLVDDEVRKVGLQIFDRGYVSCTDCDSVVVPIGDQSGNLSIVMITSKSYACQSTEAAVHAACILLYSLEKNGLHSFAAKTRSYIQP
jgi:hypothetical protein